MIKRNILYVLILVLLNSLISCEQKPDFDKVYENLNKDLVQEVDTSLIYAGFGISIKDIETRINAELGENLMSDKDYVNRGGIKMKLNVDRTGKIELSGRNDKLYYKIPVNIKGKILINESILGVKIRAEPGFELSLTLHLASGFRFYNDLQYKISTEIVEIEWPGKPVVQAGPIKVDITKAIESVFLVNENFLSEQINKTAKSEIKLKELVINSIAEVPKYNLLKTKDIDLWIELSPQSLIIESRPSINNDTIRIKAGISTFLNVTTKKRDSLSISISDLNSVAYDIIPDQFDIELKVNIAYQNLDTLIQKQINKRGIMEFLPEGITLQNLQTGKWDNDQIYLSANVNGQIKGLLLNKGRVQFDSSTNIIFLNDMESSFYSENWFWSVLYKIYFPGLKSQVQDKVKWPLDPLFEKVELSVEKLFLKLSGKKQVDFRLKDLKYNIRRINLKKDEIEFLINIKGSSDFNFNV